MNSSYSPAWPCAHFRFGRRSDRLSRRLVFIYGVAYLAIQLGIWGPYLIGKTDSIDAFKNKIFKIYNDAEKLHLKFCKRILGVHLKSTNLAVYAELGKMPQSTQMCTRIAKFWLRIKSPKFDNTLVGKARRDVWLDLCTKPVSFITHILILCGVKMKDFKSFNISQRS